MADIPVVNNRGIIGEHYEVSVTATNKFQNSSDFYKIIPYKNDKLINLSLFQQE